MGLYESLYDMHTHQTVFLLRSDVGKLEQRFIRYYSDDFLSR